MRTATLVIALLVAACGAPPCPVPPPPPVAGADCEGSGGACSPDGGALLGCSDGGWVVLDDCRGRKPCYEAAGSLQCGR